MFKLLLNDPLVRKAYDLASIAHHDDKRWDGTPYIEHPIRIARRFNSPYKQALALLHDVMEDHPEYTGEYLKGIGFEHLLSDLYLLTHQKEDTYTEYILKISQSRDALMVKMADLQDNLRDLEGPKNRQRRDKYELAHALLSYML